MLPILAEQNYLQSMKFTFYLSISVSRLEDCDVGVMVT